MGEALKCRLKQMKFSSPQQEAILNLMVATSHMTEKFERVCAEFGITAQQYNILRILRGVHPEAHRCGEIAARMIDRSPDVTRRIDALEKQGLVERERLAEDRRVVLTKITQKGLDLLDQMCERDKEGEKYLASRLTKAECLELSRLCEKLYSDEP